MKSDDKKLVQYSSIGAGGYQVANLENQKFLPNIAPLANQNNE